MATSSPSKQAETRESSASEPKVFAARLQEARKWVEQLERQHDDLDQAMEAYQKAMDALQWCRTYLQDARLKVEQLLQNKDH
jgi:exodeoxyribonuclease VII small subunit